MSTPKIEVVDTDDVLEAEQGACLSNPFYPLQAGYLWITTKEGKLIPFIMNSAQRKFLNKVISFRAAKKRVRFLLLKARQMGFSTEIEAFIYCLTSQQKNRKSLVVADEDDKAKNLFSMTKLYHEELERNEPHLAPELKRSNEQALEFEGINSKIFVDSGKNVEASRSFTYQYVHLSEAAFFSDLSKFMLGLNQSVPDFWDSMIILETTGNGRDKFYKLWKDAVDGKNDWTPVFMPWFEMDEYRMPLQDGEFYPLDGINFGTDYTVDDFLNDESELRSTYKLDDKQINWRRWAIVNKCEGDIDAFKQEYPATWQEAVAMTGDTFFDRKGMEKQEAFIEKPKAVGSLFEMNMAYEFREMKDGKINVYEYPRAGEQYIGAFDASEGVGQDDAAAVIINSRLNTTVATISDPDITPEELAEIAIKLCGWYNNALAVPETKGYGSTLTKKIHAKHGNIYFRKVKKKDSEELVPADDPGFVTNEATRSTALAQLNQEVRDQSTYITCKSLYGQMQTFIQPKTREGRLKKPEAAPGCNDGLVMCRAIAALVRQEHPFVSKTKTDEIGTMRRRFIADRKQKLKNGGMKFRTAA